MITRINMATTFLQAEPSIQSKSKSTQQYRQLVYTNFGADYIHSKAHPLNSAIQ